MHYLLPNHARGDRYLRTICKRAHRLSHPFRLRAKPAVTNPMLTYGYLGNIARQARCCQKNPKLSPYNHVLIADHGFGPESLRNNIYRLAVHDQILRGVQFSRGDLLSSCDKNAIHAHLKSIQNQPALNLMGQFSGNGTSSIALLIKTAPVIAALQLKQCFDPKCHAKQFAQRAMDAGLEVFSSFKRLEIRLTPEGEREKTVNKNFPIFIDTNKVEFAACPTSMFAINLILKGIPVELSKIHPLHDQLGCTIPTLSQADSLQLAYEAIILTTFSMSKIRKLEALINQFKPKDSIKKDAVNLV